MGFVKTTICVIILAVAYKQVLHFVSKPLPNAGGGFAAPGWRKVADLFRKNIDEGREAGGILTVYHKGEKVVQFWGGYAHKEAKISWNEHTLGMYCSTTKFTGALVIAVLVDRGLMDYNHLVIEYWPEFGQHGKDSVTVQQLLSHQAGLAVVDEPFSIYDILYDPEKIGRILASQKPSWTPGEAHGYHGVFMGPIMDQLVRRVDPQHRSLSQFFQDEIAEPFGIDFYIGLPKEENYRTAFLYDVDLFDWSNLMASDYWNLYYAFFFEKDSLFVRSIGNPKEMSQDFENHPDYRQVPSASSHGFGTGESLAKLLDILVSGGEQDGQVLLSQAEVARLAEPVVSGRDIVLLRNITFGHGLAIRKAPHGGNIFGSFGAGGQIAYADLKHQLSWSYVTNHHSIYALGDNPKTLELEEVMYECLQNVIRTQGG